MNRHPTFPELTDFPPLAEVMKDDSPLAPLYRCTQRARRIDAAGQDAATSETVTGLTQTSVDTAGPSPAPAAPITATAAPIVMTEDSAFPQTAESSGAHAAATLTSPFGLDIPWNPTAFLLAFAASVQEREAERERMAEAADRAAMLHLPDFLREKPWGQYYDLTRGLWTGDSRETRPEPEYEPSEGELRRVAAWGRGKFGPGMGD